MNGTAIRDPFAVAVVARLPKTGGHQGHRSRLRVTGGIDAKVPKFGRSCGQARTGGRGGGETR